MSKKFITLTREQITTPNQDGVVYTNRWWALDEKGEFLFYKDYFHPQCNSDERIVDFLNKDKPERGKAFLSVAYIPLDRGNWASQ